LARATPREPVFRSQSALTQEKPAGASRPDGGPSRKTCSGNPGKLRKPASPRVNLVALRGVWYLSTSRNTTSAPLCDVYATPTSHHATHRPQRGPVLRLVADV